MSTLILYSGYAIGFAFAVAITAAIELSSSAPSKKLHFTPAAVGWLIVGLLLALAGGLLGYDAEYGYRFHVPGEIAKGAGIAEAKYLAVVVVVWFIVAMAKTLSRARYERAVRASMSRYHDGVS